MKNAIVDVFREFEARQREGKGDIMHRKKKLYRNHFLLNFHTSETKERGLCALPHEEIHSGARACMRRGHHAGLYLHHRPKPCILLHSGRKHNLLEKNLQVNNTS